MLSCGLRRKKLNHGPMRRRRHEQPAPHLRASARAISRQGAIHRARDTAAVMERRRRVHRRRARRPHRAAYPGEHAQGEMDTVRGAPWPGRIDGHAGEVSGVAGMSLTLLAPELRATGEAQRTVTRTGVVIGGAWHRPMPALTQDAERLQAALLDRRTAAPRPLLLRLAAAFWRWC